MLFHAMVYLQKNWLTENLDRDIETVSFVSFYLSFVSQITFLYLKP